LAERIYIAWRTRVGRDIGIRTRWLPVILRAKLYLLTGAPPYLRQVANTVRAILGNKPKLVIAELPQGPLLLLLSILKFIFRFKLVVDVHTAFLVYDDWKGVLLNKPFTPLLQSADLIIVHNSEIFKLLPKHLTKRAILVYDPPRKLIKSQDESDYILLPASWRSDEPLEYILEEFLAANIKTPLVITGDYRRRGHIYQKYRNVPRIVFTGYLSNEEYLTILSKARAVIVATTREYTLLSAGWEAIYAEKIAIVSETKTLKRLFGDAAIYFKPHIKGSLTKALKVLDKNDILFYRLKVKLLRYLIISEVLNQLRLLAKTVNLLVIRNDRRRSQDIIRKAQQRNVTKEAS
jgi:glycosyltransferase involved in cell wall biosynthesis